MPDYIKSVFNTLLKVEFVKFRPFLIRCSIAFLFSYSICGFKLDYIESYLYDLRVSNRPAPKISNKVVQVIIDAKTIEALKGNPKGAHHTRLLNLISEQKPLTIAYAWNPKDMDDSMLGKQGFADSAAKISNLYFLTNELQMKGDNTQLKLPSPFEKLNLISGPKSSDSTIFAKDGVTRRMMLSYQDQVLFHPLIASQLNPALKDIRNIRGHFNFLDSEQIYIDFSPKGSLPKYSFSEIEKLPKDTFSDKIVIIGQDLGTTTKDYISTPYSRDVVGMTTAEMHGNMIETLLRNSSPIRTPYWLNVLITFIISCITINAVFSLRPLAGLLIIGSTFFGLTILGYLTFWPFGIWINLVHPYLAIFLCYYFFIPYRLILENRKSWEYYQKHKLLQEVEELKTNFIGMMSHDLKTPLARIIGMTDIILKEKSNLNSEQYSALKTIKNSSLDLLNFINTILNYAKIESQGLVLNLQSRDINQLILEVIQKYDFLSKEKNIELISELEPIFSIKIDPDLMKQVISNLIENAIKYSPNNSKVLISTEETNEKIIIQVADQGIGIDLDDQENIFMKFFRSKNAKSSPIKGSGLGLYLAKYFIQLHGGEILIESSPGQGSTFIVEIPTK
jgi:signal transduction histidine kinase